MRKIKNTMRLFYCAVLIIALGACRKTEFMPDPEGAKVPFENTATKTVEELLTTSAAKIFYSAWQKSNVKDLLKSKGDKISYTVFAPSDAAMQGAGLSASVITQMPVNEVDSLIMFYTSIGGLSKENLSGRQESTMVKSLLNRPDLYSAYYEGDGTGQQQYDPYYYKHYVALKNDELLVNGKSTGKLNYTQAKDGAFYVIDKAIEKAYKSVMQTLKDDGRFTIFLEAQRLSDEQYIDKIASDIEPLFGYKPDAEEIKTAYATTRKYYEMGWGVNKPPYQGFVGKNVDETTTFAPTDEAFKKAGFQTAADVLKFNERGEGVRFDDNFFQAIGSYPMDSVFTYHRDWGRMFGTIDPTYGLGAPNATVFYSNDLQPALLNEYYVSIGGTANPKYGYKMPLEFSIDGNTVKIKVKGSEHTAAKVIETDINTMNGPIHVIDNLLLPKGFKIK